MVYGLGMMCVVLVLLALDQRRQIDRLISHGFIERQTLQSKCDALNEALLREKGTYVDLSREQRNAFRRIVQDPKNRAFQGFKRDMPATPPKPDDKS